MTERQLALNFEHRPSFGGGDFIVAGANREAVDWIDRWPDWTTIGTVIVGPPGSGKTHLTNVWKSRSAATEIELDSLAKANPDAVVRTNHAVVVEALDQLASIEAEIQLLHVFNLLAERRGFLLLTARKAPAQLRFVLPDLASRLKSLPVVTLRQPDDELLGAVIRKLFSDRQLTISEEVVRYLLRHGERSFASARQNVELLDRAALEQKREVTISLVKDVLTPG